MVTLSRLINEVIYPLLGVLGVILRPLGALAMGLVAGRLLRHAVIFKKQTRFFIPLVFLGTVALFGVTAYARWSSPGTLAMLGLGIAVGWLFMERRAQASEDDQELQP